MKNTYYLIETDSDRTCAEVLETYTNKKKAIADCRANRKLRKTVNAFNYSEHICERITSLYYVTSMIDFVPSTLFEGGYQRVPREAIIF